MGARLAWPVSALVCVLLTACTPAPAVGPSPSLPQPQQSLVDTARDQGSLGVIVTLAIPSYRPEGELPDQDAVQRQHAEIEAAQSRLLDELKPFKVELIEQYERLPQLALNVDEAAMRHLVTSPLVASVHENKAEAPNK